MIAADHGVEFAVFRGGRQVGGILFERLVRSFRVGAGHFRAAAHARHRLAQRFGGHAVLFKDFRGLVRLACRDADEQVFGGDVFVAHRLHFLFGLRDRGGQLTACLRLRCGRTAGSRQRDQGVAHRSADGLHVAAGSLDEAADHTVFLA